jgi:hypothetical protein
MNRARERHRLDDLHERPPANPAASGLVVRDGVEMELAAPHELKAHRRQEHAADRTFPGLAVDDLGMHRTRPGNGGQVGRRDGDGSDRDEEVAASHALSR